MKMYLPLLLLSVLASPSTDQQAEKRAFALLDRLCAYSNFQASFAYHSQAALQEQLEAAFEGTVTVQGNQYRLATADQEIINDGKTVWTYLAAHNEVQIDDHDPDQVATMPWTLLTGYRQDYAFCSLRTQQDDKQVCDVVALRAKDEEATLLQVILTIERGTNHIKRLEVLDNNETWHVCSITAFVTDLALDASFFSFDTEHYPGIEIDDFSHNSKDDETHT